MDLKDTVALMTSEDPKDRLRAEYYQLKIRSTKLEAALAAYDKGELNIDCPPELLRQQLDYMHNYAAIIEQRATYEGVTL